MFDRPFFQSCIWPIVFILLALGGSQKAADAETFSSETRYFKVQAAHGLDKLISPILPTALDQCAEKSGLLEYLGNDFEIALLIARDKSTLDLLIEDHYDGQITLSGDSYVQDEFCGNQTKGSMFVTGETISVCVTDEEHWAQRIEDSKICPDIIHEMVHIVQNKLAGGGLHSTGQSLTDVVGPAWLFEGAAVLFSYQSHMNERQIDLLTRLIRDRIPTGSRAIADMEEYDIRNEYQKLHYLKGMIATKFLADRNGENSIFDFYQCLGRTTPWKSCFQKEFGMTVSDFYSIRSLR